MNKRKRLMMIVAIVLVALLVLPFLIMAISALLPPARAAVTQSDIDAMKGEAREIEKEKEALTAALEKLKKDKAGALEQKDIYDRKIDTLNKEIENKTALIAALDGEIAGRTEALEQAVVQQAEGKEQFESRVAAMQRAGSSSYLGILLEAESFSDFLMRWEAMGRLIEYDNKMTGEYRRICVGIEGERAALEVDLRLQTEYREGLTVAQDDLCALSNESGALIDGMMTDISSYEKTLDEQEKAEKKAQDEIAQLQATLKKQREDELRRQKEEMEKKGQVNKNFSTQHTYVGGAYSWPVPGYYTISSGFGYRIHPVYGVKKYHTGIDIPAPRDTPVTAANSGTVISRAKNGGYGNYIVVDHGGGQATLYAHLNKFAGYEAGSSVKKGDTIGYIGTTGVSTGYHLHFEVIKDGGQVNPEPLLRG